MYTCQCLYKPPKHVTASGGSSAWTRLRASTWAALPTPGETGGAGSLLTGMFHSTSWRRGDYERRKGVVHNRTCCIHGAQTTTRLCRERLYLDSWAVVTAALQCACSQCRRACPGATTDTTGMAVVYWHACTQARLGATLHTLR